VLVVCEDEIDEASDSAKASEVVDNEPDVDVVLPPGAVRGKCEDVADIVEL